MKQLLLYLALATLPTAAVLAALSSAAATPAHFHTIGRSYAAHIVHPVATPCDTIVSDSLPLRGGLGRGSELGRGFSLPLQRVVVTSPYGLRRDPLTGKRKRHLGLDLRARNEEVFAMLDGIVLKAGENKRAGKYITLQHGDYTVTYCHLSRVLVPTGTAVHAGDTVALSGNTGTHTTGPHLHITLKHGPTYLNPAVLLAYIADTSSSEYAVK